MHDPMRLPKGDLRLLDTPVARRLLSGANLARLAYVAIDGTPRVVPIGFVWDGTALVFATVASTPKLAALRKRPAVALTVDVPGPPPEALSIRGVASIEEVDGIPAEYRAVQERFFGSGRAAGILASIESAGTPLARIVVTPKWVDLLDFEARMPRDMARLEPPEIEPDRSEG